MNKTQLVSKLAERTELKKKDVAAVLDAFTETVKEELAEDGKVQLVGFGTFKVQERAARNGRNPQTGERLVIAARKAPVFKAGSELKDSVK